MRNFACALIALLIVPAVAQEPDNTQRKTSALPTTWIGTWAGETAHIKHGETTMRFRTELRIAPLGKDRWQWRITYGAGGRKSVRPYELVAVSQQPGHFRIDEKNSIVIDAYLENNRLHSRFAVGDNCIGVTYALSGDSITMTLRTYGTKPATTGGVGKVPPVRSYALRSVQRSTLKRVGAPQVNEPRD